jgi:hypothetical protein
MPRQSPRLAVPERICSILQRGSYQAEATRAPPLPETDAHVLSSHTWDILMDVLGMPRLRSFHEGDGLLVQISHDAFRLLPCPFPMVPKTTMRRIAQESA